MIPSPEQHKAALDAAVTAFYLIEYPKGLEAAIAAYLSALPEQTGEQWEPIADAPRSGDEVDIWVTGHGSRRIADCRWGIPARAKWGDRHGDDQNLPAQWITRDGCALDRRNGVATHFMRKPAHPTGESP